tara:strand:+ start:143 stop:469 length:327 start_codon:yes stop_codon:yes gene_type:complete
LDGINSLGTDVCDVYNEYSLLNVQNKKNKGVIDMDFKTMLMNMAEAQADKMKEDAMDHIKSDEFSKALATKLNERINIPFVSEDKEQILFEKVMDVVTDMMEGFFKGK